MNFAKASFIKRALAISFVTSVSVCTGGSALAAQTGSSTQYAANDVLIQSLSNAQLIQLMKAEGYTASIEESGEVRWKLDGLNTFITIDKDQQSLLFYVSFENEDDLVTLERVNQWNLSKRYSRSYLDEEGDPFLELDLDLKGGVTRERVINFLKTCRLSFSSWLVNVMQIE